VRVDSLPALRVCSEAGEVTILRGKDRAKSASRVVSFKRGRVLFEASSTRVKRRKRATETSRT